MDYEKAYKEAIKRAKLELKVWGSIDCDVYKHLVRIFPELAESEDERIRKKLIEAVKGDMVVGGTKDKQRAIAWLEKQKPIENNYPAYNSDEYESFEDGNITGLRKKQKTVEWNEKDEEMRLDAIKYLELFDAQGIHGDKAVPAIEWLKSLKPQNRWKPSDEQINLVEYARELIEIGKKNVEKLNSLTIDFKKSKEE